MFTAVMAAAGCSALLAFSGVAGVLMASLLASSGISGSSLLFLFMDLPPCVQDLPVGAPAGRAYIMPLQFTDEEFQSAWKELDEPQLEGGWELFVETTEVKIYRLYDKETGLYEYKVYGVLTTCTPELCADVYMDLKYRKDWDGYVKELYEKDFDGQSAIYWEVKYPFPLSNRDYVYVRERRDLDVNGRKIWVILARSSPETPCAEKGGVLRVKDYNQSVALESDGAGGTKLFMNYFDNPGGNIPTWLVNWAAKKGVPGFITDMQKACRDYNSYCQKK